eukprot:6279840-Heterocapsa_arctica.AAC.1
MNSEMHRLIKVEAEGELEGVKEQPGHVLHDIIGLVRNNHVHQLAHDGVLEVDLHLLLEHHVEGQ